MAESRAINFEDIANLDEQIKVLLTCKPLPESQIKILCDKVSLTFLLVFYASVQRRFGKIQIKHLHCFVRRNTGANISEFVNSCFSPQLSEFFLIPLVFSSFRPRRS